MTKNQFSTIKAGFFKVRAAFLSGVLVAAPLMLTIYVIWSTVVALDTFLTGLLPSHMPFLSVLSPNIPGLGLILALLSFTLIGWLTKGFLGKWIVHVSERVMHNTPIIRSLYKTLKQIFEALFDRDKSSFRQVVMLEYPRTGTWVIGFTTGVAPPSVQQGSDEELLNIFIPTTPVPTNGFLLFVPKSQVRLLPMSVEEGIKLVVSIGLVAPGQGENL